MTLPLIHAGHVIDAEITIVLFSKGLLLETRNLKAKDVFILIKQIPQSYKFL